jgi:GNAT superfamily N-acetyltransferase
VTDAAALSVRSYEPAQRADLHRIAADTAFFGEPAEIFLEDRRVFLDIFYAYYTDCEPEHAWVACAGDTVVGFLTGCVDTPRQERMFNRHYIPRVLLRALQGRYRLGRRTWRFAMSYFRVMVREPAFHADLTLYPAHLHINVDARWRGHGLGRRLIEAYLGQLRSLHIRGVHLHTTNLNETACWLYTRVGFQLLDARPTRLWAGCTDRPVESRCYGLVL